MLIGALLAFTCWSVWMTSGKTDQKKEAEAIQGDAAVGGDFSLTNQNGQLMHAADFHGRVMLVFFGFTHCPDICPITVAAFSKTMELLGPQGDQVAPIFITVDPERDTPQVMKDYLSNFDKRMVGLTGTEEQIKQVTEAYKVYFAKAGAGGAFDHSAFIYMMGKDGKFIQLFENNAAPADIAAVVKRALE